MSKLIYDNEKQPVTVNLCTTCNFKRSMMISSAFLKLTDIIAIYEDERDGGYWFVDKRGVETAAYNYNDSIVLIHNSIDILPVERGEQNE